jgi:hypothetical protein
MTYWERDNKKGSRFHGSLIKSIAFPQKLIKRTSFEEII